MLSYKRWLGNQSRMYQKKFRDVQSVVRKEGLRPDHTLKSNPGGPFVDFLCSSYTGQELARLSFQIASVIGSTRFWHGNIVNPICVGHRSGFEDHSDQYLGPMLTLAQAVTRGLKGVNLSAVQEAEVTYEEILMNQTQVVAVGYPNQAWYEVARSIREQCKKVVSDAEPLWGSHITIARCTREASRQKAKQVQAIIAQNNQRWRASIDAIRVGLYSTYKNNLTFRTVIVFNAYKHSNRFITDWNKPCY